MKKEKEVVENKVENKEVSQKQKNLLEALSKIDKLFGKGTVMNMADKSHEKIDVISTGSLGLDIALGVGGLPRGRIVEIYGGESSAKTTICIHTMVQCQKNGGNCLFVDTENAFDLLYSKNLGIEESQLWISQPSSAEQAMEIIDTAINSGSFDMIVLDSVAALVPQKELDGDMSDSSMALVARLMSKSLRKITGSINKTQTLMVFINQTRLNIGGYGNPMVTTGGNALKFYASVRLESKKSTQVKEDETVTGNLISVKVVKSKIAPPFTVADLEVVYGKGVSRSADLLNFALLNKLIVKSGSWFSMADGTKLGQGSALVKQLLEDNEELASEIEKSIREKYNL